MSAPPTGALGALVRQQRELLGISMAQLAERSRVSRSTIHRLEHDSPIRPTPSKLARLLAIVGIDEEGVRSSMPDDEYRSDLLHWMAATDVADDISQAMDDARAPITPDLVAIHPDGTVARIVGGNDHLDGLADAIKRAGWLVTRPA